MLKIDPVLNVLKRSNSKRYTRTMLAAGAVGLLTLSGCNKEKDFFEFEPKKKQPDPITVVIDSVPPRQYDYDLVIITGK